MQGEKMYYPLEAISGDDMIFDAEQKCMVSFENNDSTAIEKCKHTLEKGNVLYGFFEGESNPREIIMQGDFIKSSQQLSSGYFSKIAPVGNPEKPVITFKDKVAGMFSKNESLAMKKYNEELEIYNQWQKQCTRYEKELSFVSGLKSKRRELMRKMITDGHYPLIDPERITDTFLSDDDDEKSKETFEKELAILFSKQAQLIYLKANGIITDNGKIREYYSDFINVCSSMLTLFDANSKARFAKDKKDLERIRKAIGKEAKEKRDILSQASIETIAELVDKLKSPTDETEIPDLTDENKKIEKIKNDCYTIREETKRKFEEISATITPDDSIYKKIADLMALKLFYKELPDINLKHVSVSEYLNRFSKKYFENLNIMDVKKKNEIALELLNNKGIENRWNGFEEISRVIVSEGNIPVNRQKTYAERTLSMKGVTNTGS